MKKFVIAVCLAVLTGCTGSIVKDPTTGTVTVDVSKGSLAVATHNDLLGAAKVAGDAAAAAASKNDLVLAASLQARANKWLAFDSLLTMQEAQASACLNAIAAMKPQAPASAPSDGAPHVFTDLEVAAEAVGNFSGLTPAVKLACADLPLPALPVLPRL
jgi:hypothetical protein